MSRYITVVLTTFFALNFAQQPAGEPVLPRIKSSVSIPVKIPLAEVANIVNASMEDLIFEDRSFTDNDNDQFKVKVWRTRPIRLVGGTKQNLLVEVPLKIWAEKGIGALGVYSYQNTTFETVMYFNTQISLNNNWTLAIKTTPMGFKWVSKPVLDFGRIKVPITAVVEESLKKQQAGFCRTIDGMMLSKLNLQPYAVAAWNQFSQPFNISAEYRTWLKITPLSVNISPLVFYGNQIGTVIGIDTYSETFTGNQPADSPLIKSIADFNMGKDLPGKFLLHTTANISFTEATRIAEQAFLGKELSAGGSRIKLTGLKVYGENDRIMIEAITEGSVSGTSFISGVPVYDQIKRKMVLTDTEFNLKTKNILQKTATVLFRGKIVRMIEEEYGIPTAELEDSSRKSIEEAFNREYYKGLKMQGRVYTQKPTQILLNAQGITAVIATEAELKLLVKGF